jgi:ribosomal-protein-alanine N-acetyltransferase
VPELQRLRADHGQAVLSFELANRDYFALSISDRGDDFYRQFTERHAALLAEQAAGISAFYLLVDEGSVLGRFNLYDIKDATASLGYRVAEHVADRRGGNRGCAGGVPPVAQHGLRALTAGTSSENVASQRVLIKAGFVLVGPANPTDIGGKRGMLYRRDLAAE